MVTLFSELLKAKDEEVVIFDYLVEIQLPRIVAEAIVNVKDINSELAAGLYKLVTVFSNYPIMQKLYQNDNTVNLLYLEKTPTSRLVLANQWDSILHVMNNETLLFFLPLVEIAMKNVLSINGEIWQHHAICFRFLSKISALEEAQPLMKGISKAVTNVIMSFPNHSIALGSAVDLAIQLASIPDFDISEMMNILPVAALMVKERRSVIVASWCFKLIRDVRQLTPAMTKLVDSLEPDVLNIIKTTSAIIETPYGGSIPKPEDSFGGLTSEQEALIMNDVTPEQILNIRKYFIRKL